MTEAEKNERIKAVEEEMAKLQKELEDIRSAKVQEWDFSAWDRAPLIKKYEFNIPADPFVIVACNRKLDALTAMLKFKFCYDYSRTIKYYIMKSMVSGEYEVFDANLTQNPTTVYFSSEEIAQKCADWLNAGCPEE